MGIGIYLKEIGRGKDGARSLSRAQAADLMGQVLDASVTDLEIGAFCLAMRVKGETPQEMAGFLDAVSQRINRIPAGDKPNIVIPSYNGARKLPVLTPLLALLLAREGWPVLVHGTATESKRVFTAQVFAALGHQPHAAIQAIAPGSVAFVPTKLLCEGLQRLLDVRRVVNLRNSGHSLVKLMNPCQGSALIVSSYTHPEYALSMAQTFKLTQASAFLLRGTEGEPVADARRTPQMDFFHGGDTQTVQAAQAGALQSIPDLPETNAADTAAYIEDVLKQKREVPAPIAVQVQHILQALKSL